MRSESSDGYALPHGTPQATPRLPHWRPALSVGNAKLDEQHIILLETGRNLLEALAPPQQERYRLVSDLKNLLIESLEHDRYEENILATNGCPNLELHHQSHERARALLTQQLDQMQAGDFDSNALSHAIVDWMKHHIGEFDVPVKSYMRATTH